MTELEIVMITGHPVGSVECYYRCMDHIEHQCGHGCDVSQDQYALIERWVWYTARKYGPHKLRRSDAVILISSVLEATTSKDFKALAKRLMEYEL